MVFPSVPPPTGPLFTSFQRGLSRAVSEVGNSLLRRRKLGIDECRLVLKDTYSLARATELTQDAKVLA